MDPRVIVLILSYNGKSLLDDSVSSYLDNDYSNFEVCVVDNGSSDGTVDYVRTNFPKANVIRTDVNLKYSGGFNFGLKNAFNEKQADYALITNNDVKVDRRVISELVAAAQKDEKYGFVTGKVYYYDAPEILQTVGKNYDEIYWNGRHIGGREVDNSQYEEASERFFADDIFTLVRRELYLSVGGYDTEFQSQSEEYDWQTRAKMAGYKIFYTPKAKMWHKESMIIGQSSAFKNYFDSRNPTIGQLKYRKPEEFKKYFWRFSRVGMIWGTLIAVKRLEIKRAITMWAGFFSGLNWGIKNQKLTLKHIF